ncbi:MAG: glycosyltransferase family 2 protein [Bacteroidota bacterium]|nr:glycosyltransferase family 2 protein [Bacteroidota bacterium]
MTTTNSAAPLVYCVVLNWNKYEETIECVKSLRKSNYERLKIVLVDNDSGNESVEVLRKEFPDITLLCNTQNAGYASGNNIGIRWALENKADYILVLNNDVIIDQNLILEMLVAIQKDQHIGVVTGKMFYKDDPNRIYSGAGKIIRWRCSGVNRGTVFGRMNQHNKECMVDYVCGALFLARSEVFLNIGLMDEGYFMYFEDLEFSRRVNSDYSMVYTPKAIAYHKSGGGTRWYNYPEVYHYYQTRNRFIVFKNDPQYYRIYVLLFTSIVTLAKSVVIFFSIFRNTSGILSRLKALWKGWRDGIKYT